MHRSTLWEDTGGMAETLPGKEEGRTPREGGCGPGRGSVTAGDTLVCTLSGEHVIGVSSGVQREW